MMLPVLYLALVVGAALLVADLLDRLRVDERRLRWWRGIAAIAAVFAGLQPAIFGLRVPDAVQFPFHLIAAAYLVAAALYLAGLAGGEADRFLRLRRCGYGVLLALGALPSFLLLFLAPIIALAGIGLARPKPAILAPSAH